MRQGVRNHLQRALRWAGEDLIRRPGRRSIVYGQQRPDADPRGTGPPRTTAGPTAHQAHTVTATGTIPKVRLSGYQDAPDALHHEYVGDWGFRPIVPERVGRGARTYVLVVFWFMLVVSVELWWLDTPAGGVGGGGGCFTV